MKNWKAGSRSSVIAREKPIGYCAHCKKPGQVGDKIRRGYDGTWIHHACIEDAENAWASNIEEHFKEISSKTC